MRFPLSVSLRSRLSFPISLGTSVIRLKDAFSSLCTGEGNSSVERGIVNVTGQVYCLLEREGDTAVKVGGIA